MRLLPASPVVVERVVPVPRQRVWEALVDPDRHAAFDGSGQVLGRPRGAARLQPGGVFSMRMHQGRVQYRSDNHVVEFEEGQRLGWVTTGVVAGRWLVGGQLWRYLLADHPEGTLVRHEYDWARARASWALALLGYPRRMRRGMVLTLQRMGDTLSG
ncbi:SRPBCC domain-containing protein [Ornithinicoccus halotolerans]|uniref:SRPBCC domain-containing protein n=1 Tax=Ornithinicoccus halotolerans TaxID=1748220 RepID=UPI001E59B1D1|nr:SRPBCC domain-containing protein [Ornithinicoccus halotolerans]